MSIRVTPDLVEAVAPEDVSRDRIDNFVNKKKQWIYCKVKTWPNWRRNLSSLGQERFVTGAWIPFCGRNMKLREIEDNINRIVVS